MKRLQLASMESLSPVSLVFTLCIYFDCLQKWKGKAVLVYHVVQDYTQLEIAIKLAIEMN